MIENDFVELCVELVINLWTVQKVFWYNFGLDELEIYVKLLNICILKH